MHKCNLVNFLPPFLLAVITVIVMIFVLGGHMSEESIYDGIESLGLSTDIRGWHSTSPFFKNIIDTVNPSIIAELGSWKGASAIHMASLCSAKIYCIDTWLGGIDHVFASGEENAVPKRHGYPQLYFQFLHNVKASGFADRIIPFPNTTLNGLRYLKKKNIEPQLIYIDASHETDDVAADVSMARTLFPNAVLFGDDWRWPSVKAGLRMSVGSNAKPVDDGIFWVCKP